MTLTLPILLAEQIYEVRRELRMREQNYPRWIAAGTLEQARADKQMARLKAALATLEELYRQAAPELPL